MAVRKPIHQEFTERADSPRRPYNRQSADNRRGAARESVSPERTPGNESIDEKFTQESSNYNSIQNAQVIRAERNVERQKNRARLSQIAALQAGEEQAELTRAERIALAIRAQAVEKNGQEGIFSKVEKNIARVRVISVTSTIALWATPIYLTMILPIGLLATGMFGIAVSLYAMFGVTSDGVTVESILGFSGVGIAGSLAETFLGLFFVLGFVILFLNIVIILGASAEYKIAFIKPWFGNAAALKLICIILTIICSVLPLVQMAPMALLWVAAVFFYPK